MENISNNQLTGCQHVQLGGTAIYDESKFFFFAPDNPTPGNTPRFRKQGVAQQMSDGSFDFVASPPRKAQSKPIKKLAHGRLSRTKDNAIQLTLKVFANEDINIAQTLMSEAFEAKEALISYQLKK